MIRNVTAQDIRRVDLEFGFSHALDVVRAEEVLASILSEHPKVLLGDWEVYWDLTREAKVRLDREGIPVGLPRLAVQLPGDSSDSLRSAEG